jgi:hypothetical protein
VDVNVLTNRGGQLLLRKRETGTTQEVWKITTDGGATFRDVVTVIFADRCLKGKELLYDARDLVAGAPEIGDRFDRSLARNIDADDLRLR